MNVIQRHMGRVLPRNWGKVLSDPRRCVRRWSLGAVLGQVMNGLLGGCRHLRELEMLGELTGQRLPDTTVRDLLVQLDPRPLDEEIARGIRKAARSHEFSDKELPLHLVVVDGKSLSVTSAPIDENSINRSQKGCPKYVNLAMRAFLGSSRVKVLLGQSMVPAGTNERGAFPAFLEKLVSLYGKTKLLEVFSLDAGYTSKANAQHIINSGRHYIMALKNLRGSGITQLAVKLLGKRKEPDFIEEEYVKGQRVTRKLFRASAPQKDGWEHAYEVWRVCKETLPALGRAKVEEHYYITSLPTSRLSNRQVLKAIRLHWSIENNANWVMDTAWKEDDQPWCYHALELISLMRIMAYNAIARLKFRRMRSAQRRHLSWKDTLQLVKFVLFPIRPGVAAAFC